MEAGVRVIAGGISLLVACVSVGLVWLVPATAATAAPARVAAADGCCTFAPGPFEQARGEVAVFDNPSSAGAIHNVYSVGSVPGGGRLFFSETIRPGNEVPIRGTEFLEAGEYPFVCTVHPGMDGALTITTEGSPLARPSILAKVAGQRLATVVRKGSLRLSVTSRSGAQGARVTLRAGRTVVTTVPSVTVPAGTTKVITAKLSAKGRAVLKRKRSIEISATSSVDFGKSSTTRKVLR